MDINQFVEKYPKLYHVAEAGSWNSIKEHGLWCTSKLLEICQHPEKIGSKQVIDLNQYQFPEMDYLTLCLEIRKL